MDWTGPWPTLLTSAHGELAIAVFGKAQLGETRIGTDGPPYLALIRVGRDGKPPAVTRVAPSFAWSHPLALLEDGGLIVDGEKPGDATTNVARVSADGSIAWMRPLPTNRYVAAAAADLAGGAVGIVLRPGRRYVDSDGEVRVEGDRSQMFEEVRSYDVRGGLRFSSRIRSSGSVNGVPLAVRPGGGLIRAGYFGSNLLIESDGPPASVSESPDVTTPWVAAWDAHGRVSWLRKLAMTGRDGSIVGLQGLGDGTVRAIGLGYGELVPDPQSTIGARDRADPQGAAARKASEPALFIVRLDGGSGAVLSAHYRPDSRTMYPWRDDLIDLTYSRIHEEDQTSVAVGTDGIDRTWWRTELGAGVDQIAAAPNAILVLGHYDVVMTLPGREPPAVAIGSGSDRSFLGLLAWEPGPPPAAAKPAATRFTELQGLAMRAFRAKRFREACDLFVEAQRALPSDAANMADLALCLQRADDTKGAVRANRYAIRLASAPGGNEAKNLRVRKAAYFNLDRLGAHLSMGNTEPDFGCTQPVYADWRDGTTGGAHGLSDFVLERFALDPNAAAIAEEEYRGEWSTLGTDEEATVDRDGDTAYDVTLDLSQVSRSWDFETEDSSSAGCRLVHADGCSGHLGFACHFQNFDEESERRRIIELTLKRGGAGRAP